MVIVCSEARRRSDRTIDVEHDATTSADEMVMVVTDAVFVAGSGPRRLDAPNQVLVDEQRNRVVHRLTRDRPDHSPNFVGQLVGGGVAARRYGTHDRQPLSSHLHPMLAKKLMNLIRHAVIRPQRMDSVKYLIESEQPLAHSTSGEQKGGQHGKTR